jgi:hypothetical protein
MREKAEENLNGMLAVGGLKKKPSYTPGEVQSILNISDREFHRLVNRYELDHETTQPRDPCSLDSFRLRSRRRVRYDELVDFLYRNNNYERSTG